MLASEATNVVCNLITAFICFLAGKAWTNRKRVKLAIQAQLRRGKWVRVSAAYLFRIKVHGKYLLIRGKRIKDQFQPVGGVYKAFDSARSTFNRLGVVSDDSMKSCSTDSDDLRIRVKGENLLEFLDWFDSGAGREVTTLREFNEELIRPGYLESFRIESFNPQFVAQCERILTYSQQLGIDEVLVHDVYEVILTDSEQKRLAEHINDNPDGDLALVTEEEIERKTFATNSGFCRIAETAGKVL
ncbi:MAG: hypothetical protein Q4D06_03265 [Coriobacteriia bacterium]|nr:hypothetical protein [Coriobacteriia bacterium]